MNEFYWFVGGFWVGVFLMEIGKWLNNRAERGGR